MKKIKYFIEFVFVVTFFFIFKIIGSKHATNLGKTIGKIIGPWFRSNINILKNLENSNIGFSKKSDLLLLLVNSSFGGTRSNPKRAF